MSPPTPFQCEIVYADGSWSLTLSGELDIATASEIAPALAVVRSVEGEVTLDLRGLEFMDASGLNLILGLHADARRYGFEFRVLTDGGSVQRVLAISGVSAVVNALDGLAVQSAADRRTHHAVIATDIGGLLTLWNHEAERLYGWSALEVLGRPIMDLMVVPEDRQVAEEIMNSLQRNGYWEGEFGVRSKTGSRVHARVRNALITDLNGDFCGFVGVSVPCSEAALTSG
jgi:anti-anti-sigma factor